MESTQNKWRRRLAAQIDEIARMSADERLLHATSRVSAWTPAEHLDHIIKVSSAITGRLLDLNAPRGQRGIRMLGRILLLAGRIPRGRGKAPETLRGVRVTSAELLSSLDGLRRKTDALEAVHLADSRGPIVPHPRFGGLTPAQAIRFAIMHNDHHFRIIRDVLRGA